MECEISLSLYYVSHFSFLSYILLLCWVRAFVCDIWVIGSHTKSQRSYEEWKNRQWEERMKSSKCGVESIYFIFKSKSEQMIQIFILLQKFKIFLAAKTETSAVISKTSRIMVFPRNSQVKSHFVNWSHLHSCSLLTAYETTHKEEGNLMRSLLSSCAVFIFIKPWNICNRQQQRKEQKQY